MLLDETYSTEVRHRVPRIAITRLSATSIYRFTPPLLATIARGFHVPLSSLGVAVSVSELIGLGVPFLARRVERWPRRTTILIGLFGMVLGAVAASVTTGPVTFSLALMLISLSKSCVDIGTNSWVTDHVPYGRLARVIGITEMSWSGALLIGVPVLLGVSALTGWRGGFIAGAGFAILCGFVFVMPFPRERPLMTTGDAEERRSLVRSAIPTVLAVALLTAGSQSAFVTFGSWLHDRFGFGDGALAGIAFLLGLGELTASFTTSRLTDRWGKRQSMRRGASLMVPTAVLLAIGLSTHLGTGLVLLVLFFLGFEFAIVSSISLTSNLIPGRPSAGIGFGIAAGTFGRAVAAIPATRLYDSHGFGGSMILAGGCAAACALILIRPSGGTTSTFT